MKTLRAELGYWLAIAELTALVILYWGGAL